MTTELTGTWYIVRTSLALWRRRAAPALTYAPLPDGSVLDATTYRRRGRTRRIIGVDTPDGDGGWVWRGVEPLTLVARSRWRVIESADSDSIETGWMIIHFSRTPFTAEGVDLCLRSPDQRTEEDLAEPLRRLSGHPVTAPFAPRLFVPGRG